MRLAFFQFFQLNTQTLVFLRTENHLNTLLGTCSAYDGLVLYHQILYPDSSWNLSQAVTLDYIV